MPPRYNFSSAIMNSQIFIVGGFGRENNFLHTLNRIDYHQYLPTTETLCPQCLIPPVNSAALTGQSELMISSGFWHSLSLELSFPFKAIDLILDAAISLGASELNIAPMKNR